MEGGAVIDGMLTRLERQVCQGPKVAPSVAVKIVLDAERRGEELTPYSGMDREEQFTRTARFAEAYQACFDRRARHLPAA